MESSILQQETLRQVTEALRHSRSKEGLERRMQEILSENFATLDKAYEQKFQELRNIVSGTPSELIGNTRAMQEVERQIRQIANSEAVVLIRGAAGTGKEHAARTIHTQSERNGKAVVQRARREIRGRQAHSLPYRRGHVRIRARPREDDRRHQQRLGRRSFHADPHGSAAGIPCGGILQGQRSSG